MDFDDLDELEDGLQKVREDCFRTYVQAAAIGGGCKRGNVDYTAKLSSVPEMAGTTTLDPGAALVVFLARVEADPTSVMTVLEEMRPALKGFLNFMARSIGDVPLDLLALRSGICVNDLKAIGVHTGAMWLPKPGSEEQHPFPTHCIACFLTELEAMEKPDFAAGSVCFMPSAGGRRCMCGLDQTRIAESKMVASLGIWARKEGECIAASVPTVISSYLRFLAWFSERETGLPRAPLDSKAMGMLRDCSPGTLTAPEMRMTWVRGPSTPDDDACGLLVVLHSAADSVRHCKFFADHMLPGGEPYRSNLDVVLFEADFAWEPAMFPKTWGGPPRKGWAYFRFDSVFTRLGERLLSANRLLDFLEDYLVSRPKCKVDLGGFSIGATLIWTSLLISSRRALPCERAVLLSPVLGDVWFATQDHITDRLKAIEFFVAWGEEEGNSVQEGKQIMQALRGLSAQLKRYPGGHAMTTPELEDVRAFLAKGRR